ncbi:Retrovirus-related Pol polyprotein from type-1 retrotransposable element R1 [Eumeta japonica]|uniref:Retrovirus-related Pol polyprotein from type-1 retrotransposable element R1 n=1 Tax=Eumeta variegata TaxID=151549 RepID=A0A4C1W1C4_EUMVA|nr:Retrovirus-related Pol polyprotein from type-1 retrotransposable element R1 [Eumeta japonica]
MEGRLPNVWKEGKLVVLPKSNGKYITDSKVYPSLTLFSVLGKTLEQVILRCSGKVLGDYSDSQHGFTKGRSTVTDLIAMLDSVRASTRKYVQLMFLDISSAFDRAWWPMILVKLRQRGCLPNIYTMLVDYFSNGRVGLFVGSRVRWKTTNMGRPQRSFLGQHCGTCC